MLDASFLRDIQGKDVLDFGCGRGADTLMLSPHARSVVGLDIRPALFPKTAPQNVRFVTRTDESFDVIISHDAFEHYSDPAGILELMKKRLRPEGVIAISFGPPWFHPYGGHLFSFFPWAHLLLPERFLCWVRSFYRDDGARYFHEVEGGLNQMTIDRFQSLVALSGLRIVAFELVPIRALSYLHARSTREFTTSVVRCRLCF